MEWKVAVRDGCKIQFHVLQIIILISGAFLSVILGILFFTTDHLITVPRKYLWPVAAMCIVAIVNGYLGFVCLNSERKTKIFLFILTMCIVLNLQVYLAIKSNRIVENSGPWSSGRWASLTLSQKAYIQKTFGCCGLETTTDRVAGKCNFDTPCLPFFEIMLRTIRHWVQKVLIYLFFIETVSLATFGFLKYIKFN